MAEHCYTVELRVWGDAIDPAHLTRELGLVPCQTRRSGQQRYIGRVEKGMWAYNGPPGSPEEWDSLEAGLEHVLQTVWPLRVRLAALAKPGRMIWWCGHFHSAFDGGPEIAAALLSKLGEFGAPLFIDTYFFEENG